MNHIPECSISSGFYLVVNVALQIFYCSWVTIWHQMMEKFYMDTIFEKIRNAFAEIEINVTDKMLNQFSMYYSLLIEWNNVMNLTAITELDEVIQKHFVDSAILGKYYNLNMELSLIDIGSGAGFPGIPLKILFPKLDVILVDSVGKRIKFLNELIRKLELENVQAIHGRAEDLARQSIYREKFDLCVSRAVANLSSLSEYCIPFIRMDGLFISYKSATVDEEVVQAKDAIRILGGKLSRVEEFQIPHTDYQRTFLFIQKIKQTSMKYPRKAGTPTKIPLHL